MLKTFLQYINRLQLISSSDKILLTSSGGIDSMVLTRLFVMAGFDFGIAHCNFKLRGDESDGDAEFVRQEACRLNTPFYIKEFDTKLYAEENQLSIQQAARALRYQWFDELIRETNFDFYATAHHFDDQIETFFINLFRGTGVSGLRGILPKNGHCVRPLLFATRADIEQFAVEQKISYREDSSNAGNNYLRNRIRHFILPALEKAKPDFRAGFDVAFNNLALAELFIKSGMKDIAEDLISKEGDYWKIDLALLKNQNPISFILFELLKPFNFNFENALMIIESMKTPPGKSFFSPTHKALLDREFLFIIEIQMEEERKKIQRIWLDKDDSSISSPVNLSIVKEQYSSVYPIDKQKNVAQLDFDKLKFPLEIRKPESGDFFYPIGLGGRKKVSDYLIDEKIATPQKLNTWLLVSEGEIVWIIGHRPDDRFKIVSGTKTVLKISLLTTQ